MNPVEIDKCMEKLEDTVRANYFAKCAIDHALYDIAGKALKVPAYTLLGGMYRNKFGVPQPSHRRSRKDRRGGRG
jgi:L-alanine-DL-glutamate epimerase-like enolase superfamily enzyme